MSGGQLQEVRGAVDTNPRGVSREAETSEKLIRHYSGINGGEFVDIEGSHYVDASGISPKGRGKLELVDEGNPERNTTLEGPCWIRVIPSLGTSQWMSVQGITIHGEPPKPSKTCWPGWMKTMTKAKQYKTAPVRTLIVGAFDLSFGKVYLEEGWPQNRILVRDPLNNYHRWLRKSVILAACGVDEPYFSEYSHIDNQTITLTPRSIKNSLEVTCKEPPGRLGNTFSAETKTVLTVSCELPPVSSPVESK